MNGYVTTNPAFKKGYRKIINCLYIFM